jgi:hypothetical protein
MSRRGRTSDVESMDLLLDTICNAFGGVVFIALLVVILVSISSQQSGARMPTRLAAAEFVELQNEHRQLQRQMEQLEMALSQSSAVTETILSDETLRLAREYQARRDELGELVNANSRAVQEAALAQQSINKAHAASAQRKAQVDAVRQEWVTVKKRLEITIEQKSREAVIPKVTTTSDPPKTFFLREGELYGPEGPMGHEARSKYFEVVSRNGFRIVKPIPSSGLAIDASGKSNEQLEIELKKRPMDGHFAQIFVWPNSYEHVEAVRVALDNLGIRCQIIPCEADTEIVLGGGNSGGANLVQ